MTSSRFEVYGLPSALKAGKREATLIYVGTDAGDALAVFQHEAWCCCYEYRGQRLVAAHIRRNGKERSVSYGEGGLRIVP